MMDGRRERIRFEHCPGCGETEVKNILRRARLRSLEVFVECRSCGEFVARYEVLRYTSNKSYEDLLSRLGARGGDSARRIMQVMAGFDDDVAAQFRIVQALARQEEDPKKIEEILQEEEEAESEEPSSS